MTTKTDFEQTLEIGFRVTKLRHRETNEEKFFGFFAFRGGDPRIGVLGDVLEHTARQGPFESVEECEQALKAAIPTVQTFFTSYLKLVGSEYMCHEIPDGLDS